VPQFYNPQRVLTARAFKRARRRRKKKKSVKRFYARKKLRVNVRSCKQSNRRLLYSINYDRKPI
jgi:hypothetical protein